MNLYAPSTAKWESAGAAITMETDLPIGDSATLSVKLEEPKSFTLALRRPKWAGEGCEVRVNDKAITSLTVRFQATDGNETAAIYGIRMIRTNSQR